MGTTNSVPSIGPKLSGAIIGTILIVPFVYTCAALIYSYYYLSPTYLTHVDALTANGTDAFAQNYKLLRSHGVDSIAAAFALSYHFLRNAYIIFCFVAVFLGLLFPSSFFKSSDASKFSRRKLAFAAIFWILAVLVLYTLYLKENIFFSQSSRNPFRAHPLGLLFFSVISAFGPYTTLKAMAICRYWFQTRATSALPIGRK